MENNIEYKNIIAFHPGYYIEDIIEEMEITQSEFAIRLGTTAKTISKLVNAQIPLSNDIAMKLSNMLGTSVDVWLNLQKTYEAKLIEIENEKSIDEQNKYCSMIDYDYFVKLGIFEKTNSIIEKIGNLRKFLKVADLGILAKPEFIVNYRTATFKVSEKNLINAKAWLQTAINIGQEKDVGNFDIQKLKSYIPEIRSMTTKKPSEFMPRLEEIFAESGVTFVLLPYLKNSNINGAVTWINSNKVILAVNDRNKSSDLFWFSLFHEIKHVLQQKILKTFISGNDLEAIDKALEIEADEFARDTLISPDDYERFLIMHNYSNSAIIKFSKSIGIQPGILLGRLEHDNIVSVKRGNGLAEKYEILMP